MAHDDDNLVPEPDDEPTAAELAHARRFADVVEKTLAGRTPPAMSAEDRTLIEVATVIRATHGNAELAPETQRSIVEDALRQAIGAPSPVQAPVTPIRARAPRAPWIIAAMSTMVAVAALVMLWLRPAPSPQSAQLVPPGRAESTPPGRAAESTPVEQQSRPADAVVGPIARDRAGDASTRIDAIFADRLDGFRERKLGAARRGGVP